MSLTLSPETERRLEAKFREGDYASVDDLIRDVLQALDERNDCLAAIADGLRDADAGRTRRASELRLKARTKERVAEGKDPLIGLFAEDAEILDQMVADIMRDRGRPPAGCDGGEAAE